MAESMCVVVVGAGYVGLTTGVALAYIGHRVVGVDRVMSGCRMVHGKSALGLTGCFAVRRKVFQGKPEGVASKGGEP